MNYLTSFTPTMLCSIHILSLDISLFFSFSDSVISPRFGFFFALSLFQLTHIPSENFIFKSIESGLGFKIIDQIINILSSPYN